jgi:curved DNA-binding protein CbpA
MNKNYYKILQISQSATLNEIKTAYRKLALKYHPDAGSGGDKDRFIDISEAMENLSDKYKRQDHDRLIYGGSSTPATPKITTYTPYSRPAGASKVVDPKHFNQDVWNYYHYNDAMPTAEKIATTNRPKRPVRSRMPPSKMSDKFINDFQRSVNDEVDAKVKAKKSGTDCVVS